jgi:hypothetical protein
MIGHDPHPYHGDRALPSPQALSVSPSCDQLAEVDQKAKVHAMFREEIRLPHGCDQGIQPSSLAAMGDKYAIT